MEQTVCYNVSNGEEVIKSTSNVTELLISHIHEVKVMWFNEVERLISLKGNRVNLFHE